MALTNDEVDGDGSSDSVDHDDDLHAKVANVMEHVEKADGEKVVREKESVPEHIQKMHDESVEKLDSTQRGSLRRLLWDYENVFARHSKNIGQARDVKLHIDTGMELPVNQRPRRQPKSHTDIIQQQVKDLAEVDVTRPSESEWASNVMMPKQKDGSCRMCIDYRELNNKTK